MESLSSDKVDIVVLNTCNPLFLYEVLSNHVVLFEKKEGKNIKYDLARKVKIALPLLIKQGLIIPTGKTNQS